ncbi:MAG: ferritin-like domain-containing protein [[Clostridium] nexile]
MCEEEIQVRDSAEYPPVKVCEKNPRYAMAMLSNIGACNSEMSGVSLYFYNCLIANGKYEEIGKTFHKISMVEMHHMNTAGSWRRNLGDPRLWSVERRRFTYWSLQQPIPKWIDMVLKHAYEGEKLAIATYKRQAEWIQDEYVVANLERIILDERLHIEIIEQLYEKYVKTAIPRV